MPPRDDRRNDDLTMGRLIQAVENNSTVVAEMATRQIAHGELLAAQGTSIDEVKDQTKEQWNTLGKISDSLWGHKVKTAGISATVAALILWFKAQFGSGGG